MFEYFLKANYQNLYFFFTAANRLHYNDETRRIQAWKLIEEERKKCEQKRRIRESMHAQLYHLTSRSGSNHRHRDKRMFAFQFQDFVDNLDDISVLIDMFN